MIVKEFINYRVCINDSNDSNIFIITFGSFSPRNIPGIDSDYPELELNCFVTKKGMNRINVQSKRNDWYLREGIKEAVNYIKESKKKGDIFISYGGSMGGFASIEFASEMNVDFFVTTSPQFSFSVKDLIKLKDPRWKKECDFLNETVKVESKISEGANLGMKGIVFVDPDHDMDMRHAMEIKKQTKAIIIPSRGTGHTAGLAINREYSITKLLKNIAEHLTANLALDGIISKVSSSIKLGYANKFMDATPEKRLRILLSEGIVKAGNNLTREALIIDFKKKPCEHSAIVIYLWAQFLEVNNSKNKKNMLKLFNDMNYQELAFQESEFTQGFYDKFKDEYLLSNASIIGPDLFRDEGLRLEESNNLKGAYFCMTQAKLLRPHGKVINQKFDLYTKALGLNT